MAYLLDADVFIRAKNLHYGFDFCPAFWSWLIEEHAAKVASLVADRTDQNQEIVTRYLTVASRSASCPT